MFCENCKKRPATMRMTLRRAAGEERIVMLCGLCAHRFTQMTAHRSQTAQRGPASQLTPELFSQHHFPTQRYGVFNGFSPDTQQVMRDAEKITRDFGFPCVGTMPLLMGILSIDNPAHAILERNGINYGDLEASIKPDMKSTGGRAKPVQLSQGALQALEMAQSEAAGMSDSFVEPQHLVLGMLDVGSRSSTTSWMQKRCADLDSLKQELINSLEASRTRTEISEASPEEMLLGPETETRAPEEPALEKFARNLTEMAREGKLMPVVGRDTELGRTVRTLSRLQKNNPLLLGEAGVGKTAVVEALAEHIASGDVPDHLQECELYQVDLTAMVAGTEMRGEFEKRMKNLIDEVRTKGPNVILFIDEIHTLVGAGASEGNMDAGNILKPALARGELHLIGATTLKEYRKYIEKDPALARRFQPVLIGEPTVEQAIEMLNGIKSRFEEHSALTVSDEAISAAVTLSNHYITDRFLPDKAVDLIDEACSMVAIENEEKGQDRAVIADDIANVVSSMTGIPLTRMIESERKRLLEMEDYLHKRIINQDQAVKLVSDIVRRSRAGLKDPTKPNGAFIFAGPTGVGKTELARALADFLFDNESALIRINMSEFMEPESVNKLLGSPPGYVGYEEGGQLTEKVVSQPYSVVLFDEMEKAHPRVLNILLQIADAGSLSDGQGRNVNFKNTIIILTTNLGAELFYSQGQSPDPELLKQKVVELIVRATSPELVNRMDEVVVFSPLSEEQIEMVIKLQVGYLAKRLAEQSISLEIDQPAIEYLAREGYEPAMGARPAKRVIQDELESTLSEMILAGTLVAGDKAVVSSGDGKLQIRKS